MITVGDVMNMRAFDSIWLAAPCEGAAEREVTGVGTLDHEPFTGGYEVFTSGEFVFTTLGFAGMHPDLAEEALLALIEYGVAAVAVKPVVLKELPPSVAQASTARGVPVFFYEGRYMERVIADLMNLLDDDAAEWERNHLIDLILAPSDEQARALYVLHHRGGYGRHYPVCGHTPHHRRWGVAARSAESGGRGARRLWRALGRCRAHVCVPLPWDASGVRLLQEAPAEGYRHLRRRPGEVHRHGRAFGVRYQPGGEPGGGGSSRAPGHGRPAHGRAGGRRHRALDHPALRRLPRRGPEATACTRVPPTFCARFCSTTMPSTVATWGRPPRPSPLPAAR